MTYTTRVRVLVLGLLFVCILPFGIARADDAATSTPVVASSTPVVTEQFGTVRLTVRDGDIVATSTMVGIPLDATSTLIAPTGTTTPVLTSAQSVLAVLVRLAASSSEFTISDLQYYPSFGSFYLNCLTIPSSPSGTSPSSPSGQATSTPLCGQWQYSVNNFTPAVGMDSYTLKDGDTVFVYFGYPRKVTLESASVASGTPFTATAVSYDPATDTYSPASCLVVGVTQADPANPYTPTVIATSTSDAAGHATFTLTAAGDYFVGLEADYYTPATSLSVSDTSVSVPPPTQSPTTGGGGGSPATTPASRALAYLLSQQKPDGSITRMFIDDWAAVGWMAF